MLLFTEVRGLSKDKLYFWKLAEFSIGMENHLDE